MTKKNWFWFLFSAVAYALPFMFSDYLWWGVFIFPIPFFYIALTKTISFKEGYLWGIIAFGLHLSGVLYSIFLMATGSSLYRLIPSVFIVLYEALSSGIIFWIANKIITQFKFPYSSWKRLFIWISALFFYFFYVSGYCLFIFDLAEGYFFMHPLLPLTAYPKLLRLLPIIGKHALTLFLIFVPATCTMFFIKPKTKYLLLFLLSLSPWIGSIFIPQNDIVLPHWINKISPMQILFPESANLSAMMEMAGKEFKKIATNKPEVRVIIMPESSFYCNSLVSCQDLLTAWDKEHLGHDLDIIVGAFRWDINTFHNTCHWIKNGKLQAYFDKRHAMLLTERVPSWFNISIIQDMYFSSFPIITISKNPRPKFKLSQNFEVVPYICSELFFNELPDDNHIGTTVLSISNDIWFETPYYPSYVQTLMNRVAQFKALQWSRDIIYIAFSRAFYIQTNGKQIPLR